MATLAYLVPPVTGAIAYLGGATARVRFHGLQAVTLGLVWPVALYAGSWVSARVTQAVAIAGALLWLALLVATLVGRDPRLPGLRRVLERL
ncbi:MAG: hypothetical protein M3238_05525 [Actinomycetota bacterium]|nr:hypothetical protein [Actinomycetota bacterium]